MKNTFFAFIFISVIGVFNSCSGQQNANPIKSVTTITEVFGDGQKAIAAAVEFDKPVQNTSLSSSSFSVEGRTVTKVYANDSAAKSVNGKNGKYAIIELSPADKNAATFSAGGKESTGKEIKISVKQVGKILTTTGEDYAPSAEAVVSSKQLNPVVDDFKQFEYKDAATGRTLNHNLYIPKHYDKSKVYPMVMFMHDAGEVGTQVKAPLVQGLGAVIWATPSEQAKHESFVLAPQYAEVVVNDQSEATADLDVTVSLIHDLVKRYSIDTNRLYTTGQSMGCMMSVAMDIKYPDLFAASLLVAGQWDPTKVAPMANDKLWIIVSEDDEKAFPGMNAITATLEKKGAKVCRATWNATATPAEFGSDVNSMLAGDCNIRYAAFKKGTVIPAGESAERGGGHRNTWRVAYTIEGVRDWLFRQKKL